MIVVGYPRRTAGRAPESVGPGLRRTGDVICLTRYRALNAGR